MTIKERYNKWLFEKYGFDRGGLFEGIPITFRINPLFSPSMYAKFEGQKFAECLKEGMDSAASEVRNSMMQTIERKVDRLMKELGCVE